MSQQQSLERQRAAAAWQRVADVKQRNQQLEAKKRYEKEYSALARGAPADIQVNGLGQTLAFWRAKGCEKGQPKQGGNNAHYQLLLHTSAWLSERGLGRAEDALDWIINQASTDEYRRATAETIAFLIWLKRFAEAELGGE